VNKTLDDANAWITVLCKKLAPWWPWVRPHWTLLLAYIFSVVFFIDSCNVIVADC